VREAFHGRRGEHLKSQDLEDALVVSPDVGRATEARRLANYLNLPLAMLYKRRNSPTETEVTHVIGEVEGKRPIIIDDMISTAGSVASAAVLLKERGARDIYVAATHGILCGPGPQRLSEAPIEQVVVTDTVPLKACAQELKNLTVLSVAPLVGEAISRIHRQESVSSLFMSDA